jgi:hypothetical protein
MEMNKVTLVSIPVGGRFRLSEKGIWYVKRNNQGMGNSSATIINEKPRPSRKCHLGIKMRVVTNNLQVFTT